MIILTLRTDKPEAEVGIYKDGQQLVYETWAAHRELAETIHKKINNILNKSSIELKDVEGLVVYKGPGSFTGLRIGLSVANALAYALSTPIVATSGANWIEAGLKKLDAGQNENIVLPEYGGPAHTTQPRK